MAHFTLTVEACAYDPTAGQATNEGVAWAGRTLTLDLSGLQRGSSSRQYTQILFQLRPGVRVRATVGPQPAGRRRRAHEVSCLDPGVACYGDDDDDFDMGHASHHATVYSLDFLNSTMWGGRGGSTLEADSEYDAFANATMDGAISYRGAAGDNSTGDGSTGVPAASAANVYKTGSRRVLVAITSNCDNKIAAPVERVRQNVLGAGDAQNPTVTGWFATCSRGLAQVDVANSLVLSVPVCFSRCPGGNVPGDNGALCHSHLLTCTAMDRAMLEFCGSHTRLHTF